MEGIGRVIVDATGDGTEPAASGRGGRRDSFFLAARLRLADAPTVHDVRVRNLSPGGMMIELERVVDAGLAVTLEMRGLGEVTGQVAWCTGGRIGVSLDRPIDPRRARKPVGGGATTPEYAKAPVTVPSKR